MTYAAKTYYTLTIKLCALIREGKSASDEAEQLRDGMDHLWWDMTEEEMNLYTYALPPQMKMSREERMKKIEELLKSRDVFGDTDYR